MKTIIVVGAGIIGVSLAYRLASGGAQVTVVDRAHPASGATGATFGWLNASFYFDAAHHRLRAAGLDAWVQLAADVPDLTLGQEGAIWCEAQGAELDEMHGRLASLSYAVERLDNQRLAQMVPGWRAPDAALYFAQEAVADGAAATQAVLAAAMAKGVKAVLGVKVVDLMREDGRVIGVETDAGSLFADHTVVAAGVGAAALIGLPMKHRPGLILKTQPMPAMLRQVLVTPDGEIRQDTEGRLVMPTAIGHQGDQSETLSDDPMRLADLALARLQSQFPGIAMEWSEVTQARRPVPEDDLPVIGAVGPGLYATVMHSGMTLAAITAEYAAQEILRGDLVNELGPYRPGRFTLSG